MCQYETIDFLMCIGRYTSIKTIQNAIHKCIIWPKKLGKGRQTWDKVYINYRLKNKKLNTFVKIRYKGLGSV